MKDDDDVPGQVGTVVEALPNAMFRIALDSGHKIVAHIPARPRMHIVRVIVGDRVRVTLSRYDETRGRLVEKL